MAPGAASRRLSAEVTVTLRRSSAGYGMKVKPVVIRSAPTSGPLVSGTYTMLEVADVDAAGVAAAGGVLPGDILLKVCGISVQSGGAQALMAAMATAAASEGDAEWRFMRLSDAVLGTGANASGGDTLDRKRMAAVLRAYQERAATLVQAQWRGRQGRKQMPEQLEHEASLVEQQLSKSAVAVADPAGRERVSEWEMSESQAYVRHRSAVTIQSRWRGLQARQRYWVQLEDEAKCLEREMDASKVKLASVDAAVRVPFHDNGISAGLASNPVGSKLPQPADNPPVAEQKDLSRDIQCTFDNTGSLGISFGCQGVRGPVYITKIKGDSPAARQPQLSTGLVLAAVQGTSVVGLDFHSTLQLVKHAQRPVTLVFSNPPTSNEHGDLSFDDRPARCAAWQTNADTSVAASTSDSARLGQQLQSVGAGPESDSARALEVLKQARQRLSDAHQHQMKMALQAATEAAERQVHEATQAANRRHEQLAAQTRQAHVKHVQVRVAEAQQLTAQQHMAAAVIQGKHRQRQHRKTLSRVLQMVAAQRNFRQRELESSASANRRASVAESEEPHSHHHALRVQTLSIANADLQQDLSQMTAQRDEAKRRQVVAETMYQDEVSKSEEQSRRAAELELLLARTQEECSAKLQEAQRALQDEQVNLSRARETVGELLAARDNEDRSALATLERHVSACKIQTAIRQHRNRSVVKAVLRAHHTTQNQMHRDLAQALASTVAADAQTRKSGLTLETMQQQLDSVVSERDALRVATEAMQAQNTQVCTENHAAATIQRRYHDFCHSRSMKRVVAAATAYQHRSAAWGGVNNLTGVRAELAGQHVVVQDLRRELAAAKDSQRRANERRRTMCSQLQRAWRGTRQLREDLADMRIAVQCQQQQCDQQLRLQAAHVTQLILGVYEDHACLVAVMSEEKRKAHSLHAMQLASANELVQLQGLHASQLESFNNDLRESRSALEASRLAQRQATEQHKLLSDTARSQEVWVAKVRAAQERVREAELRVQAAEHQKFAQQDEVVNKAAADAVREAEFAAEKRATARRSDEGKLEASQKLSAALQRAESAEKQVEVMKLDLEQTKQKLSVLGHTVEMAGRQDPTPAAQADEAIDRTQPSAGRMASISMWTEAMSGGPAWVEVVRKNTESTVAQMRAEAEVARLRRQLQLTTQLMEELEIESAQKDEQITALQSKVNALRRLAWNPQGHSGGTVAPMQKGAGAVPNPRLSDGTGLGARSDNASTSSIGGGAHPPSRPWTYSQAALSAVDPGGTATPGWQSEVGIGIHAQHNPSRKMIELETSVGDLVQRLQSLGHMSVGSRQTDQRALDDLRRRLRSSDDVAQLHRWPRAASDRSGAAMVR